MLRFGLEPQSRFVPIVLYFTIYENIRLQAKCPVSCSVKPQLILPNRMTDLPARSRFTPCPAQFDAIDLREKSIVQSDISRKLHGIGVAADHIRKMPVRGAQHRLPGKDRNLDWIPCPHAARALI